MRFHVLRVATKSATTGPILDDASKEAMIAAITTRVRADTQIDRVALMEDVCDLVVKKVTQPNLNTMQDSEIERNGR